MRALLLPLVLASSIGCGDGGPTLADICDEQEGVFVALYTKLFSCYPELGYFVGDVPAAAEMAAACDGSLGPYLDDGTVTINGAVDLAACRAYIEALDCNGLNDADTTPCDDLLVGTLELGAECDGNDQCVGDAYCEKPDGASCGTCRAQKTAGMPCQENFECVSDFCHEGEDVCAEHAEAGEACDAKDDCGGTRVCSPSSNTCVDEPAWAEGTPCRDFIDCDVTQSGLYCDTMMMECRAFLTLGDPCSLTTPLCNFIDYETCKPAGAGYECTAPTTVTAEGGECGLFEGLRCAEGMQCRDHDETESTPSICVRLRDPGEACNDTDQPCRLFLECVEGMCQYGGHTGMCPAP